MVTHFFTTPHVEISFDERIYHPGDLIDVTVTLDGSEESHHVRSGEVELVATVKYSETRVVSEYPRASGSMTDSYIPVPLPRPRSHQVVSAHEAEYTLAAVNFIKDEMSGPGELSYTVQVLIAEEPPPNWRRGTTDYRLVVVMDLAGERDVHAGRDVRVSMLPHP